MSVLEPRASPPGFSGSYAPEDVTFLLRRIPLSTVPLEHKERLIQSGQRHYSEMLSPETPPSEAYLALFEQALEQSGARLARDLLTLADRVEAQRGAEITLLSLARGGTPIGVLLRRELARRGRTVRHFSVSILRDRGLDTAALDWLLEQGLTETTWTFVDGWSAKGVIADELQRSLEGFNQTRGTAAPPELFVVSDLSGKAAFSATNEDYLIPSSLLNATVSGLLSRTVLERHPAPGALHGAALLEDLREHDHSRRYVDTLWERMQRVSLDPPRTPSAPPAPSSLTPLAFLEALMLERNLPRNHLKPGIGEATRTLLRRVPERLLLRDPDSQEVTHLRHLALHQGVRLEHRPEMPFQACALIARLERAET